MSTSTNELGGITENADGTFTATHGVEVHTYKTRRGAEQFIARRNPEPPAELASLHVIGDETLRPLAEIEADAERAGLMKPKQKRQSAAQRAQKTWDAQEEPEQENAAQKRAQGFVCTFAECVHHSK